MSWLGEWLKHVILIVLLATFVDLILPSRSMERYVKLVLSLLILFTLLSPIVELLQFRGAQELKQALSAQLDRGQRQSGTQPSLEQILAEGEKMYQTQEKEALDWAGKQVAAMMKEQVEEHTGQRVQAVEVAFTPMQDKATGVRTGTEITAVRVRMDHTSSAGVPRGSLDEPHTQAGGSDARIDGASGPDWNTVGTASGSSTGATAGGTDVLPPRQQAEAVTIAPVEDIKVAVSIQTTGSDQAQESTPSGDANLSDNGGAQRGGHQEKAEPSPATSNEEDLKGVADWLERTWGLKRGMVQIQGGSQL
ncbi:Stage III sporulation protein AF [compost metagenome]